MIRKHIIVIDDTGSPGNFNETKFLKENRKTLVGVFIHAELREKIEEAIKGIILILNTHASVTEIHLTDIVNRDCEFTQFTDEDCLHIIEKLSNLLSQIDLPCFVQTCHNKTFEENGINITGKEFYNFDFNKNEDKALFLLLIKIRKYLREHFLNEDVEIIMDEGRKKNYKMEEFKILKSVTYNGAISFRSSKEFILLQIADIFAYSVNRIQMTLTKEIRTEFDNNIFLLLNEIIINQISVGTTDIEVELNTFTKDDYDNEQL